MTTLTNSPRLVKGALVGQDPFNPVASLIQFQYNPETLTRTLQPQGVGDNGGRSEAIRLKGAPVETMRMDVEIDATDQLQQGIALAKDLGIHPQLAALEMLIYPKSSLVITNSALMATGTLEVLPPTGPYTLLVWGARRVLPVRLTEFSITEEAHDERLNPIRAKVSLNLRVLSYNDSSVTDPNYSLFMLHQIAKETFATIGSARNAEALGQGVPLLGL